MSTIDVTKSVMTKVVDYERRRTGLWVTLFVSVVLVAILVMAVSLVAVYSIASERQTWDILTLFSEDPEIIMEFWQDALSVFYEELPQKPLLFLVGTITVLIVLIFLTRKKRTVMRRRLRELAKNVK